MVDKQKYKVLKFFKFLWKYYRYVRLHPLALLQHFPVAIIILNAPFLTERLRFWAWFLFDEYIFLPEECVVARCNCGSFCI